MLSGSRRPIVNGLMHFESRPNFLVTCFQQTAVIRWKHKQRQLVFNFKQRLDYDKISDVEKEMFKPPKHVHGMKFLNRNLFKKKIKLPCFKQFIGDRFVHFDNVRVRFANIRCEKAKNYENTDEALLLPGINWDLFTNHEKDHLYCFGVRHIDIREFQIGYEFYSETEIFSAVLPEGFEHVQKTQSGSVVVLILQKEQLPYTDLISQVLLDKFSSQRFKAVTVIMKKNLDQSCENFSIMHLNGEKQYCTMHVFDKIEFYFDISKVMYTSQSHECAKFVLKSLQPGDVVFDLRAGFGEYSLPIAKRNYRVFANETHEESFKWLCHNTRLNEINLNLSNINVLKFIHHNLKVFLLSFDAASENKIHVYISHFDYPWKVLQEFNGLLQGNDNNNNIKVIIHCNVCVDKRPFKTQLEISHEVEDIKNNISNIFNGVLLDDFSSTNPKIFNSEKDFYCCSFSLPTNVLFGR